MRVPREISDGGGDRPNPSRRLELLVAVALIGAVGIAVYGRSVLAGGFHADDWVSQSRYLFHPGSGVWATLKNHQDAGRAWPVCCRQVWVLVSTAELAVMGFDPMPYHLQNLLVGLVESMLMFAAARCLCIPMVGAVAMGLLLLVYPDADATRLFGNDAVQAIASALLLGGALVGMRGADTPGPRGLRRGVLALLLLTLSIFEYELTAPTVVVVGFLFVVRARQHGTGWQAWGGLFALDCLVVGLVIGLKAVTHPPGTTLQQGLEHAAVIARQTLLVAERAVVPFPVPLRSLLVPIVLVIVALAAALGVLARDHAVRMLLRRDLAGLALALAVVVTGYLMIVPGASGYMPDSAGMQGRINAVAAIGMAIGVVSLISLAATVLTGWLPWRRPAAAVLVAVLAGAVIAGDVVRTSQHAANWERAAREQSDVLATLSRAVPAPRDGLTVFAFGRSGYAAPAIPIFGGGGMDDMREALRVTWRSRTTQGYPVLDQMHVSCQSVSVLIDGIEGSRTSYGRAVFVDVLRGTTIRPTDARECRIAADAMLPYAPVNETEVSDFGS